MQKKSQKKIPKIDLTKKSYKEVFSYLSVVKKLILKKQVKIKIRRPA